MAKKASSGQTLNLAGIVRDVLTANSSLTGAEVGAELIKKFPNNKQIADFVNGKALSVYVSNTKKKLSGGGQGAGIKTPVRRELSPKDILAVMDLAQENKTTVEGLVAIAEKIEKLGTHNIKAAAGKLQLLKQELKTDEAVRKMLGLMW